MAASGFSVVCIKVNGKREFVQKHVMIMTTSDAYTLFKSQNKDVKIGLSTFKSFKLKQVRQIYEATIKKKCASPFTYPDF
jgi:hypothetical protein